MKSKNTNKDKKKKDEFIEVVNIPERVSVQYDKDTIIVSGEKGVLKRVVKIKGVNITIENNSVKFLVSSPTKKIKRLIFSNSAHLRNMIKGVTQGHIYKMKICASHFPMNVSVHNGVLEVKNFIGEKIPRRLVLKPNVDVKIEGDVVVISSHDKEAAGAVASDIEQLTRRPGFDPRRFQDGIYIIEKDGKRI